MTNDKIEEAVARAIAGPGYARHGTKHIEEAGRAITAYKSALSDTHVLVPREPTEAMLKAADEPHVGFGFMSESDPEEVGSVADLTERYKAMLAAHEKAQEDETT